MVTCIVHDLSGPPEHHLIFYTLDEKINPATLTCTEPSTVGRHQRTMIEPLYRQSKSLRNQFRIDQTNPQNQICLAKYCGSYFHDYFIGLGSKHQYDQGDFMKPHYDTRHPDLQNMPHCMTLVITIETPAYQGGDLIIDHQLINKENPFSDGRWIMFPLTALHEVTPVTLGTRFSYCFPVYGNYKPIEVEKYLFHGTIYELKTLVFYRLQSLMLQYPDVNNHEQQKQMYIQALGYIAALKHPLLESWFRMLNPFESLNIDQDECNLYDGVKHYPKLIKISYHLKANSSSRGHQVTRFIFANESLPSRARKVQITTDLSAMDLIQWAITEIQTWEVKNMVSSSSSSSSLSFSSSSFSSSSSSSSLLLSVPVLDDVQVEETILHCYHDMIIGLTGKYYENSKIQDLSGVDAKLGQWLCSKKINFYFIPLAHNGPTGEYPREMKLFKFESNGRLISAHSWDELWNSYQISSLELEFSDQVEYIPRLEKVMGVIIIEKLIKKITI